MKSWLMATVAAGMAVVASARTVEFNKNFMAAGAKHRNRIAFNTYSVDPLPLNLLATNEIDEIYSSPVECDYSTTKTNSGSATVMIAIDKCLNASSIALIETWVNTIKGTKLKFTDSTGEHDLTFDTTLVEGQCRARTEKEKHGREIEPPAPAPGPAPGPAPVPLMASDLLADGTNYRLHKNVLPGEVERIAAFAKFGRVLTSTDDWNPETIAVVSFVNNEVAYNYVEQFDQKYKISHTFNFQICEGGESCDGHFENCVFLEESVDLFMYNPFTITHSWSCTGKVADGIPVTIVDAQGQRKCYCTCPAGSKMEYSEAYGGHHCVVNEPEVCPCVWADHPFQYDNIDKLETCLFTAFATTKNLPVPFPTDNYVSDYRTNDKDVTGDLTTGPHIDVSIARLNSDVYEYEVLNNAWMLGHNGDPLPDSLPDTEVDLLSDISHGSPLDIFRTPTVTKEAGAVAHNTWKDYQQHRQDKIDEIEITAYGKYEIAVKATDYLGDAFAATCTGCISIVDKYRPKHHDACPTNFCDNSTTLCHSHAEAATAEFTPANQVKAKQLISDFYTFQSTSFNDACEVEDRCDDESFKVKKFFESADTNGDYDVDGSKCFDTDQMTADFLKDDFAKTNPLVPSSGPSTCHQHDVPVPAYQCTRCCDYSVALKEWWIDYTCGHDYDIARCDGDSEEHCETRQCLVLFGDTLATVTANIKGDVKDESDRVLAGIVNEGFQSVTQVHRALQCTKFGGNDGVCNYEASISDLIDVHVTNNFGSADDQYVFWRYKIKGDPAGWRLYNPADLEQFKYTFTDAQTKIILEAWTVCGISRKFYFYVHLHVHSEIKVCDFFAQMWYQTSVSHKSIATTGLEANSLLSFPGSDFAELTFDYQANIGLQYSKNDLRMHVSGVSCSLEFIDPVITKAPVEFLNIQGDSPDIIDRFAVELQEFPHTTTTTKFTITCTFTYTRYDGSTFSTPCSRSFEVDDSTGPYIDPPGGECQWDACAGQGKPGPGEACGGKIVKSHGTAAYVDDFTNDEAECCEGCGVPSQCVSIFDLDTIPNPIKRCVPPAKDGEYGAYGQESYGEYYSGTVELMAQTVANHPTAAAATALLAASAMVAVVALVVVRRRRAADKQAVLEDAYYPLLH